MFSRICLICLLCKMLLPALQDAPATELPALSDAPATASSSSPDVGDTTAAFDHFFCTLWLWVE